MYFSPVMSKQHVQQSILMSPADEMQYSTMDRPEDSNMQGIKCLVCSNLPKKLIFKRY